MAAAAKQPHRRGERSNVAATPWQRAIKAGRIRDPSTGGYSGGELEAIGLRFVEARANYLKAIGAPTAFAVDDHGRGGDLPPSLRARWKREWTEVASLLVQRDRRIFMAMLIAAEAHPDAEERLWSPEFLWAIREALVAMGRHFGVGR